MERDIKINGISSGRAASGAGNGGSGREGQADLLIKIRDFVFVCLKNWKWFFLSLALCLAVAYYQIKKTPNVYIRTASLMIKGDERNPGTSGTIQELGIDVTPKNVSNEIMAITSVDLASKVTRRLSLDVECFREAPFHDEVAYGRQLPVNIVFHGLTDDETLSFILDLEQDSIAIISGMEKNGAQYDGRLKMKLGQTRNTPLGTISLEASPTYVPDITDRLLVRRRSIGDATAAVSGRLSAYLRSRESTIIDIGYADFSTERAENVLNAVVELYNEGWMEDRNRITESTKAFINERIATIEQELYMVENMIADYKSRNFMLDIEDYGQRAIEKASAAEDHDYEIDNQMYMVKYIKEFIEDPENDKHLIPANTGIGNLSIESQIGEYNQIILRRNGYLAHSSEQNPMVMDLDENLDILKASILQSIDNEITLLNTEKKAVHTQRVKALEKVSASPRRSNYVKSIERQLSVKESLYMFLLQKREENELSHAFTAYNSRLIEPPHGSNSPVSPTPHKTYMLALVVGLAIPASAIALREKFNTVVRGRKDLEHLSVPFVGEIPLDKEARKKCRRIEREKRKVRRRGKKRFREPPAEFVVMENRRDVMNEAFRVVRSNLDFILGFDSNHHVIMVTSLNPSSGKTFVSANLASSIGINNKRVIVLDLDMRKGNLSKYVNRPSFGISNYLSGQVSDYRPLIVHKQNIDILPCGSLPPNPSELLYSEAFSRMINELKEVYDYIFLDCPPVEMVADAAIINRYADMTLFVVRARFLERDFLQDIEKWYVEKRFNNLSIILNGTRDSFSKYGYHKYGYHYGNYGNFRSS